MQEFEIEKVNKWDYRIFLFHCSLLLAVVAGFYVGVMLLVMSVKEGGNLFWTSLGGVLLTISFFCLMFAIGSFIRYYVKCSADLYINDSAVGFNRSVDALLLANQHLRGLGVIKDETESARLLQVAADGFKEAARVSHDPSLCYKVAEVFFAEDRLKDERLAARCYLKASMLRHPGAIERLLELYAKPLLDAATSTAGNLPAHLDPAFVYSVLNVCAAQSTRGAVAADQRDLIAQRYESSAGFDEKAAQLESRRLLAELEAELK